MTFAQQRLKHLPPLVVHEIVLPPPGCGSADPECGWEFAVSIPPDEVAQVGPQRLETCRVHAHTGEVLCATWIGAAVDPYWIRVGNALALPVDAGVVDSW